MNTVDEEEIKERKKYKSTERKKKKVQKNKEREMKN